MAKRPEARFKVGDRVKLVTGDGPTMAVKTVHGPSVAGGSDGFSYRCQWFGGAKLLDGVFPEESLKPAEPETLEPSK